MKSISKPIVHDVEEVLTAVMVRVRVRESELPSNVILHTLHVGIP